MIVLYDLGVMVYVMGKVVVVWIILCSVEELEVLVVKVLLMVYDIDSYVLFGLFWRIFLVEIVEVLLMVDLVWVCICLGEVLVDIFGGLCDFGGCFGVVNCEVLVWVCWLLCE